MTQQRKGFVTQVVGFRRWKARRISCRVWMTKTNLQETRNTGSGLHLLDFIDLNETGSPLIWKSHLNIENIKENYLC